VVYVQHCWRCLRMDDSFPVVDYLDYSTLPFTLCMNKEVMENGERSA